MIEGILKKYAQFGVAPPAGWSAPGGAAAAPAASPPAPMGFGQVRPSCVSRSLVGSGEDRRGWWLSLPYGIVADMLRSVSPVLGCSVLFWVSIWKGCFGFVFAGSWGSFPVGVGGELLLASLGLGFGYCVSSVLFVFVRMLCACFRLERCVFPRYSTLNTSCGALLDALPTNTVIGLGSHWHPL